ncbi:MAG: DUF6351 family protein [Gammaproteobacteria bacterium]|nr:DUF6351 family protein [Gammaproteobacteria bacterium]
MSVKLKKRMLYSAVAFALSVVISLVLLVFSSYQNILQIAEAKNLPTNNTSQKKTKYHFWINDVGPIGDYNSDSLQNPFICTTLNAGLGQPLIDQPENSEHGVAVFPELFGIPLPWLKPAGYSKNCSVYTRVDYFYYSNDKNDFLPLSHQNDRPADLAYISRNQTQLPFIVRLERGTLNRFIYSIAMLAPFEESLHSPQQLNNSAWNGKLVYKFQGGIGIGHYQGLMSLSKWQSLHLQALARGFAVIYSTGTRTNTHFNMQLAAETAVMLKQHFQAIYGKAKFTIGIGASGGSIQQHILAEHHPGIIDAAITQASYPDMITQLIPVADCELLERYFDHEYQQHNYSFWASWTHRAMIEGGSSNQTAVLKKWQPSPSPKPGSSECVAGWRGVVPLLFNPHWTAPAYNKAMRDFNVPSIERNNIRWTHWNDLQKIYPADANGYAANNWDNVGVQYGLNALKAGAINKQQFLDLNACVGGWKPAHEMVKGAYPWNPEADPEQFDPWDQTNMKLSSACKTGQPAARSEANIQAIHAAYQSGHVFTGRIDIPVIDLRWYLEPILNMHNSIASFSTRARIKAATGQTDNHVIWMSSCIDYNTQTLRANCQHDLTAEALDSIEQWLNNKAADPLLSSRDAKPLTVTDRCYAADASLIYAGDDAWHGILNDQPAGVCTTAFPMKSNSRMQAGAGIKGDLFKCALQPVSTAQRNGLYNTIIFTAEENARLNQIFPEGVCDYSKNEPALFPVITAEK